MLQILTFERTNSSDMRILILGDHSNPHIIKWAKSLSKEGLHICIFSLSSSIVQSYDDIPAIQIFQQEYDADTFGEKKDLLKVKYLSKLKSLKRLIKSFKPDIVHAHYATSYGLFGALFGFHPLVISVWGTDVFDFPNASFLHRAVLKYNLRKADRILSTSHVMALETHKYTKKDIEITPFGIDLVEFTKKSVSSVFPDNSIVVGTIKTLEQVYGINYLIRAFAILKERRSDLPLKLLIVGGGSQEMELKSLSQELGIQNDTIFTGRVAYEEVPNYHNMLDIYVAASESESFGVAVIEASACEKPVVVTNVGGLPEVVEENQTGIVVPSKNIEAIANALEQLVLDAALREKMGVAGRKHVSELYDWKVNVQQMIDIYSSILRS